MSLQANNVCQPDQLRSTVEHEDDVLLSKCTMQAASTAQPKLDHLVTQPTSEDASNGDDANYMDLEDAILIEPLGNEEIKEMQQKLLQQDEELGMAVALAQSMDDKLKREEDRKLQVTDMQISIRIMAGKTFNLSFEPTETIETVKARILAKEDIPLEKQRLIFAGQEMKDECTLADYGVQKQSVIHLARRPDVKPTVSSRFEIEVLVRTPLGNFITIWVPEDLTPRMERQQTTSRESRESSEAAADGVDIQIFLKTLTGKTVLFNVNTSDSVESLKDQVHEALMIKPEVQTLIVGGKQLENGRRLSYYNIKNQSSIHLVLRLDGGM